MARIEENRKKYSVIGDEILEMALEIAQKEILEIQEEEMTEFEINAVSKEQKIDILEQCGEENTEKNILSRYTSPKRISENEMHTTVQKLNKQQRIFVLYVLHCLKTGKSPIRIFLSGSAGVGKSTVINCLYQIITHYYDNMPRGNKEKKFVLLCAPSGRAAFFNKRCNFAYSICSTSYSVWWTNARIIP